MGKREETQGTNERGHNECRLMSTLKAPATIPYSMVPAKADAFPDSAEECAMRISPTRLSCGRSGRALGHGVCSSSMQAGPHWRKGPAVT